MRMIHYTNDYYNGVRPRRLTSCRCSLINWAKLHSTSTRTKSRSWSLSWSSARDSAWELLRPISDATAFLGSQNPVVQPGGGSKGMIYRTFRRISRDKFGGLTLARDRPGQETWAFYSTLRGSNQCKTFSRQIFPSSESFFIMNWICFVIFWSWMFKLIKFEAN